MAEINVQLVKNPKVLLDKVIQNAPELLARVILPTDDGGTECIPLVTTGNFGFSLANKWHPLFDVESLFGASGKLGMLADVVSKAYAGEDTVVPNVAIVNKSMSTLYWQGSEKPEFSVDCVYITTERSGENNSVMMIKKLARACLPTLLSEANVPILTDLVNGMSDTVKGLGSTLASFLGYDITKYVQSGASVTEKIGKGITDLTNYAGNVIQGTGLVAPLNYSTVISGSGISVKNTATLLVGKWFQATELVVNSISNIQFSREVIAPKNNNATSSLNSVYSGSSTDNSYGYPVYVTFTMSFSPSSPLTYKEFSNYFKVPKSSAVQNLTMITQADTSMFA